MVVGGLKLKLMAEDLFDTERSENTTLDEFMLQINPASIDLTIGAHYKKAVKNCDSVVYGFQGSSVKAERYYSDLFWKDRYEIGGYIPIAPGDAILAVTREYIKMPNGVCGQIFTKSTLGRMFINHMMAGFVDPGFHGRLTLELVNDGKHSILIPVGARIVQIILSKVDGDYTYDGRYQGAETLECAKVMK